MTAKLSKSCAFHSDLTLLFGICRGEHGCVSVCFWSLQFCFTQACNHFLWWGELVTDSHLHILAMYVMHNVFCMLQSSRHYELLNYSEHGTTVDNVLYSCDFSEKVQNSPPPSQVVAQVRKVIKRQAGKGSKRNCSAKAEVDEEKKRRQQTEKEVMSSHGNQVSWPMPSRIIIFVPLMRLCGLWDPITLRNADDCMLMGHSIRSFHPIDDVTVIFFTGLSNMVQL